MKKIIAAIFFLQLSSVHHHVQAQVTPAEADTLNYRIIGCSFPAGEKGSTYTIEVAKGYTNIADSFQKHIILTVPGLKTNRAVLEVPAWGAAYTWRVSYSGPKKEKSGFSHFITAMPPGTDTSGERLRVTTPAAAHKDAYVFTDAGKALYDMSGNALWYLPAKLDAAHRINAIRDLKFSPAGTITFMSGGHMYETDMRGHILWQEPNEERKAARKGRGKQGYNHEFTRLADGRYITVDFENDEWELPALPDTNAKRKNRNVHIDENGKATQTILTARLRLVDSAHNVLWTWSSNDYLLQSDLHSMRNSKGEFDFHDGHENSVFYDEREGAFYMSFRNFNRIIRIDYPSGKVTGVYGRLYDSTEKNDLENGIFCGQHCIRRSKDGNLYLYNNNSCNKGVAAPTIVVLSSKAQPDGGMTKLWEFDCALAGKKAAKQLTINYESGGGVQELADGAILCCMGGTNSPVFIVNREKKVLWYALPERYNGYEHQWKPDPSYRASLITRKELESLIWNEPLKK